MQISNLLNSWPTVNVAERISWSSNKNAKPYRVWVLERGGNDPKPVGVMAKSLNELKEKTVKCIENKEVDSQPINIESVSILTMDSNTFIMDDEYFRQIPNNEDFLMLLPGQSWKSLNSYQKSSNETENGENLSLTQRKLTSQSHSFGNSDFRYFVPTPEGEMARLTVDVFRQQPANSGCIRLTAAAAGDAGMAVSYEVKLNGFRTVVHYAFRWTAVLMTNFGHLLVHSGDLLKQYF